MPLKNELPRVSERRPVVRRSTRLVIAYALGAVVLLLALCWWLAWLFEPAGLSFGSLVIVSSGSKMRSS